MIFRGLRLLEDTRAMVPYPEGSQFIDVVKKYGSFVRGLDIGTGSGALAMALINENICHSVVATDICENALSQARENAENNNISNIEFRQGDVWEPIRKTEMFDLIISNPPYMKTEDAMLYEKVVLENAPVLAYDGGTDGMDILRKVVIGAKKHLKTNGLFVVGIGGGQRRAVEKMLNAEGGFVTDIQRCIRWGVERFLTVEFKNEPGDC